MSFLPKISPKALRFLVAGLVASAISASAQNLIINGDFELPPANTDGTVTGWTVGGSGHVAAADAQGATSGTQSAAFSIGDSENDTLSQSFATIPGVVYTVDFDDAIYGIPDNGVTLALEVQVLGAGKLHDETFAPPVANTFDASEVIFEHRQFTFTADDTTTTLQFTD